MFILYLIKIPMRKVAEKLSVVYFYTAPKLYSVLFRIVLLFLSRGMPEDRPKLFSKNLKTVTES